MAAGDGEVQDLAKNIEGAIGAARRGPAVSVEPAPDMSRRNAVERLRTEGGKKLAPQIFGRGLAARWLVAVEVDLLPPPRHKIPEQRDRVFRSGRLLRWRTGQPVESLATGVGSTHYGNRPEREALRAPAGVEKQHPALAPGRPDPDPEAGDAAVPKRVFSLAGTEAGDGRVGEFHAFPGCHGSVSSQN